MKKIDSMKEKQDLKSYDWLSNLEDISLSLTQSQNADQYFHNIARFISNILPVSHVMLLSVNLAKQKLLANFAYNPSKSASETILSYADLVDTPIESTLLNWQAQLSDARRDQRTPATTLEVVYCHLFSSSTPSLLIPIAFQQNLLSLIVLCLSQEVKSLSDTYINFLRFLASHFALFIENERIAQAGIDQQNLIETLQEVARILSSTHDQQVLLELILDQLDRVVTYDSASIMLIEADKIAIAAHRKLRHKDQLLLPEKINQYPHILQVIEKRKPVIISDIMNNAGWHKKTHKYDIRSWMGVPLIGKDKVFGILNLDSTQPGFYTAKDASLAETFANQASIAIENTNLLALNLKRIEQMNALRETITDISSELDLSKLLSAILERAINLLGGAGGDLALYDAQKEEIEILVSHNMGRDYRGVRQKLGEGAMGKVVETLEPLIIPDYSQWENASPQYKDGPWRSVIAAPILIYDKVVGAIGIITTVPQQQFTESDKQLLYFFTQHAAIAVENARNFQKEQRSAQRSAVLHQVSQQIVAASLNPEEIYKAIHQAVRQLMPADAFLINLLDQHHQKFNPVYLFDNGKPFHVPPFPATNGLSGVVASSQKSVNIPDLDQDPQASSYFHYGRPQHVRALMTVPIWRCGKVIGVLSTQSYKPDVYSQDDLRLLEMLASYAAIALDNTQMYLDIQELAITDPLTGIFNRRHLFELGHHEFLRARRFKRPFSTIMIDIDDFKIVNDTYGHAAGDKMLHKLAQLLNTDVREIDTVGRYGGEEFTIILPETTAYKAQEIAERLRQHVQEKFHQESDEILSITISLGVAEIITSMHSFYEILDNSDSALYQAKQAGKNQVKVFQANNNNK